jgi:hypothetical protein
LESIIARKKNRNSIEKWDGFRIMAAEFSKGLKGQR